MIEKDFSLKYYNTFRFDVNAKQYLQFTTNKELIEALENHDGKVMVLGGGSNMVLTKDFDGLMLKSINENVESIDSSESEVLLKVGSGLEWDKFVAFCVENNYYGIENLSGIPGTVGACPIQNIGAYGIEVKNCIEKVEYLDLKSMSIKEISADKCQFGYRDSIFKRELKSKIVVTHVYFRLSKIEGYNLSYADLKNYNFKNGKATLKEVREAVLKIRDSKIPDYNKYGNAGSFFKNPVVSFEIAKTIGEKYLDFKYYQVEGEAKLSAAWLIEKAGFKGYKYKEVGVSPAHSLILINLGEGSGEQIFELSEIIINKVYDQFGVKLEREANII
jgi:UDP-N-acetylmuramate dehydrogenase